jgi:hypothetical protein
MAKQQRIGSDPLDDIPSRGSATRATAGKRPSTTHRIRSTPSKAAKAAKATKAPKAAAPKATTTPTQATPGPDSPDWDSNNVRVTFYCPKPLLGQVENEMVRSGISKTRVIVDAIQAHLKAP